MDATHLDHGRSLGRTSESGSGAGGLRRRNKQQRLWVEPRRRVCTVQCAVCFARVGANRPTQRSLLSDARAGFWCREWEGGRLFRSAMTRLTRLTLDSAGSRKVSCGSGGVVDGSGARGEVRLCVLF
jgi:hypothetical protein